MIEEFKEFLKNTPCPTSRNALEDYTFNMKLYYGDDFKDIDELLADEQPKNYVCVGFDWGNADIDYWYKVNEKWNEYLNTKEHGTIQ